MQRSKRSFRESVKPHFTVADVDKVIVLNKDAVKTNKKTSSLQHPKQNIMVSVKPNLGLGYTKKIVAVGEDVVTMYNRMPTPAQTITRIRKGVTVSGLRAMMNQTGLMPKEMAVIMDVSINRITKLAGTVKLDLNQSEKAVLIQKLYKRGAEVFEGAEAFQEWMNNKVISLGNKKPKNFLDTVSGINLVADEVERIEYGIFS